MTVFSLFLITGLRQCTTFVYCDILFKNGKKENKGMYYTLRDITDKICKRQEEKEAGNITEQLTDSRYGLYQKYFSEFFRNILGLKEEMKSLKKGNVYRFQQGEDEEFIFKILEGYTDEPMSLLRRGELEKAGDEFIVFICEGVRHLFQGEEGVCQKLEYRFDYSRRKKRETIRLMGEKIADLIDNSAYEYEDLSEQDRQEWIKGVEDGFTEFVSTWKHVRCHMNNIREAEKSNLQEIEYQRIEAGEVITKEDVAMEENQRFNTNEEIQKMSARCEEISKKHNSKSAVKKPLFTHIVKEINQEQLFEKMDEIEKECHREVMNEIAELGKTVQDTKIELMSSAEVFCKAFCEVYDEEMVEALIEPSVEELGDAVLKSIMDSLVEK